MRKFLTNDGRPGKIEAGCGITWYSAAKSITIFHNLKDTGSNVFHWNGDDKRMTMFICDADDFKRFAEVLAETHGLMVEFDHEDESCVHGRFV